MLIGARGLKRRMVPIHRISIAEERGRLAARGADKVGVTLLGYT